MIGGACSALAVCIGGWILLRPAEPPVESLIPVVSTVVGPDGVGAVPPDGGTSHSDGPGARSQTLPPIKVHVAGAVTSPGVYSLPAGSRVVDAVRAAGGATRRADLERINLAQTIIDTEQIYVPPRRSGAPSVTVAPRLRPDRRRPIAPTTVPPVGMNPGDPGAATGGPQDRRVNLNSASTAQLDELPGIGPATAKAIVTHRSRKGPFTKVEDLLNVPGIGPAKLAALRDLVTV